MPTQVSLTDGALASAGTLAIKTNGTTNAITIDATQVATIVNNPILSGLTASSPVFTDASKALTSTGTVGVAKGGTGLTSGTSGGVLYYSASGTLASSAALAANAIVIGGGAGAAPSTTTTGTGVVTALGNNANATGGFTTINGTATLTNKRIDPRVSSTTTATSLTPDISAYDQYAYTALASGLTINAVTGTPTDGDKMIFRVLDNGTTRTITFTGGVSGGFRPIGTSLTASGSDFTFATTVSKLTYFGCIYNANADRWDVVAITTQA